MEDDLNLLFDFKEDDLNFFENGRRSKENNVTKNTQKKLNGRRPHVIKNN